MEHVVIDAVDPNASEDGVDCYGLSSPLGTTDVAINRYRIAPGDGFPGGLHAHADQEEVFLVIEGEATFETLVPRDDADDVPTYESDEITVSSGEAIRFSPGEFQSGRNDSRSDLVAFAIGAPRETRDVRVPLACPGCKREDLRLGADEGEPRLVCPDCGAEHVPEPCPACGGDLRVALDAASRPVAACPDCGAAFETPPLRD